MSQIDNAKTEDPLHERIMGEVHFRPGDPPHVREALIQAAIKREKGSHRQSLESRTSSRK